jgi:putative DNA primase/helicase
VSTIFVHHAGKSGQQRGTSKREDLLDFVLELRRPSNHSVEEGLRVEAHLTKVRGQIPDAKWGAPFEIVLRENEWLTRPLKGVLRDRAKLMLDSGMKASEVAQEIGLSRYQVYRIQKSMKDGTSELIDL